MATATTEPVAQRKPYTHTPIYSSFSNNNTLLDRLTYGVPAPRRMLSPELLQKKHDSIRGYLVSLDLTPAERQITFHLLRLYAYYGKVYPKAKEFTEDRGCSKRSFWRAVAKLEDSGAIERVNRYLNHLQISNAYRLDKLVLCIIRYLSEHGNPFLDEFTRNIISQTANSFWRTIHSLRVRLRDPIPITAMA